MVTKIETEITIYEVNGKTDYADHGLSSSDTLSILSHGIYNDRLILDFGCKKITVLAKDLQKAIMNACNF